MARGWISDGMGGFTPAGKIRSYNAQLKRDTKDGKLRITVPFGQTMNKADTLRGEAAAKAIRAGMTIRDKSGKEVKVTAANKAQLLGIRNATTPNNLVPMGKATDSKGNVVAGAKIPRGTTSKYSGNAAKGTDKVTTRGTGSGKAPVVPAGLARQFPLMTNAQRDAALNSLKGARKSESDKGKGRGGNKGKNK